jgi:hypothetical protein
MSKFYEWREAATGSNGAGHYEHHGCDSMPILSEAMCGVWDGASKTWKSRPHSLTLWLDGAYVKFVLSCGDAWPKFYGSFKGMDAAVESVEECLREGRGDWRQPKVRLSR